MWYKFVVKEGPLLVCRNARKGMSVVKVVLSGSKSYASPNVGSFWALFSEERMVGDAIIKTGTDKQGDSSMVG